MTGELRDLLVRRAADVEIPQIDPASLVAAGDGRLRRRRWGTAGMLAAAGAAAAVVLGVGLLNPDDARNGIGPGPSVTPTPSATPTEGFLAGSSRPVVYATGEAVHIDDRVVDAGRPVESLDVTDDGVVYTTSDGGIWFTDGTDNERIGETIGGTVDRKSSRWDWFGPRWWVTTGNAGSLAAWFDRIGSGPTDLVLYDTRAGHEVGRVTVRLHQGWRGDLDVVSDDTVYWSEQGPAGDDYYWRFSVNTGLREMPRADWLAATAAQRRHILVTDPYREGLQVTDETSVAHHDVPLAYFRVSQGKATLQTEERGARYAAPRKPVQPLHLVPELPDGTNLWIAQWLDDDRFVLMDKAHDLFTCEVLQQRCELTVRGSSIPGAFVVSTFPT